MGNGGVMNEYQKMMGEIARTHQAMLRVQAQQQKRLQKLTQDSKEYLLAMHANLTKKLPKKTVAGNEWVDGVVVWLCESVPSCDKKLPVWYDPIFHVRWVWYLLLNSRLESKPVHFEHLRKLIPGKYQTAQQALPEIEALFDRWSEWVEVVAQEIPGSVMPDTEIVDVEVKLGVWRKKKITTVRENLPSYRLVLTLKKAPILPKPT